MKKEIEARFAQNRFLWIAVVGLLVATAVVVTVNRHEARIVLERDAALDATQLRPITARDHHIGSLDAPVQLIVFSDPECIYCKRFEDRKLPGIIREYGEKIVVAYRHHLLPRYTRSLAEAEAMECAAIAAGEEGFWRYTNELYRVTPAEDRLDPRELIAIADRVNIPAATFAACRKTHAGLPRVLQDNLEASLNSVVVAPTTVVTSKHTKPLFLPNDYVAPIHAAIDSVLLKEVQHGSPAQ